MDAISRMRCRREAPTGPTSTFAIATGKDLPGVVHWFRFSGIAWTKDSKGFFYARFPEPPQGKALEADLKDHQVWYHRAGTEQDQDRLIYWRKELPRYFVGADVTDDGRYLIIQLNNGTDPKNRLFYADLGDPKHPNIAAPIVAIVDEDIAELSVIGGTRGRCFSCAPISTRPTAGSSRSTRAFALAAPAGRPSCPREDGLEAATWPRDRLFCGNLVDEKARGRIFYVAARTKARCDLPGISGGAGHGGRRACPSCSTG